MQQEAPLQWFVMSGVEAVDRSMAWLAVQQLQNVLKVNLRAWGEITPGGFPACTQGRFHVACMHVPLSPTALLLAGAAAGQ